MCIFAVTPLVGVWIEISPNCTTCSCTIVTPLVGVWIEIYNYLFISGFATQSLPLWECGLKLD